MPEKLQYFFNSALVNHWTTLKSKWCKSTGNLVSSVLQIHRNSVLLLSATDPQGLCSPSQCYRYTRSRFASSVLQIHGKLHHLHSVCQNAATGCSSPLFVNRMYKIYRARKSICVNICTSNLIKEWLRHHFGGGQRSGGRGCDS